MKRIFIAFAVEDTAKRDHLIYQAKLEHSPFEFTDMSVQEPFDEKWKTNCRERIKKCDGCIALISKSTAKADGELWEIKCCADEGIPLMLMWVNDDRPSLPASLTGKRINIWSWDNLKTFISNL